MVCSINPKLPGLVSPFGLVLYKHDTGHTHHYNPWSQYHYTLWAVPVAGPAQLQGTIFVAMADLHSRS